jgi:hypothetical protein
MLSVARILLSAAALLASSVSIAQQLQTGQFEFRWKCTSEQQGCERMEAVHRSGGSGPFESVEKAAFFTTSEAPTWQECDHFGDPRLCVQFSKADMERLSEFATPENRHRTASLVFKGRVIASIGLLGPSKGPLYIGGGPTDAMSTVDVAAFLQGVTDR